MRQACALLAVIACLLPAAARAQVPTSGSNVDRDCTDIVQNPGELFVVKVTNNAADPRTDWVFDLRAKGGYQSDPGTELAPGIGWGVAPNWRSAQADTDVHYAITTYAPACPGAPGQFAVDSATIAEFDAGIVRLQEVGNSIPAGQLNSIGLTIPGYGDPFDVTLRPGVVRSFPVAAPGAVNVVFAGAIDVNDADPTGAGCPWGAKHADPLDVTSSSPLRGVIIGYNIWRIPGSPFLIPTPAAFKAALTDSDPSSGWVGFIDVRTLRQNVPDLNPSAPTPSPLELNATDDLGGMQDPNGLPFDGDEVMFFQDSAFTPAGTPRPGGTFLAPNVYRSYWYAAQVVVTGKVSDFANVGFTQNLFLAGDHRCDVDRDGRYDGVDLDRTTCDPATMDFISPQAEYGLDGLGLTHNSLPLLSAPMFYDSSRPLPASGQLRLTGTTSGQDVALRFTTGLESAGVFGYVAWRVSDGGRVRVNDQPVLAEGGEANTYRLVDFGAAASRGPRLGVVSYVVETLFRDGRPSENAGPFDVTLATGARRRR